jgi:hypothetical protein
MGERWTELEIATRLHFALCGEKWRLVRSTGSSSEVAQVKDNSKQLSLGYFTLLLPGFLCSGMCSDADLKMMNSM